MLELAEHKLDPEHSFFAGELPAALRLEPRQFEELWALHPEAFHEIKIHADRHRVVRRRASIPPPAVARAPQAKPEKTGSAKPDDD